MSRSEPIDLRQSLKVDQVAEYLQIDRWSVYDFIHSGELVAYNIGKRSKSVWRIKHRDLERFLEVREVSSPERIYGHLRAVGQRGSVRASVADAAKADCDLDLVVA